MIGARRDPRGTALKGKRGAVFPAKRCSITVSMLRPIRIVKLLGHPPAGMPRDATRANASEPLTCTSRVVFAATVAQTEGAMCQAV
jgi:hypothetical protein